jgi:hypothetical protein
MLPKRSNKTSALFNVLLISLIVVFTQSNTYGSLCRVQSACLNPGKVSSKFIFSIIRLPLVTVMAKDTSLKKNNTPNIIYTTKAQDSSRVDENGILSLYGDAFVQFNTVQINADFIKIDKNKNMVFARRGNKDVICTIHDILRNSDTKINADSIVFDVTINKGRFFKTKKPQVQ